MRRRIHRRDIRARTRERCGRRAQSGLIPGLILEASAGTVEGKGVPWVNAIRAKSGIYEADLLVDSVRERIHDLNGTSSAGAGAGPTLELVIKEAGVAELERGGFFGVFGVAQARLRSAENKELWNAQARSSSTRLRKQSEYDANPALYAEDFREVAQDIARQLVEGPIRD